MSLSFIWPIMESDSPFSQIFCSLKNCSTFFPSEFFFFGFFVSLAPLYLFPPIQVISISKIFKKSSAFVWDRAHFIHPFINHFCSLRAACCRARSQAGGWGHGGEDNKVLAL